MRLEESLEPGTYSVEFTKRGTFTVEVGDTVSTEDVINHVESTGALVDWKLSGPVASRPR